MHRNTRLWAPGVGASVKGLYQALGDDREKIGVKEYDLPRFGETVMGAGPSSTTTSSATSSPWAPAQPALQSILSQLGALPTTPSGGQTGAAANLVNAAGTVPNFGAPARTPSIRFWAAAARLPSRLTFRAPTTMSATIIVDRKSKPQPVQQSRDSEHHQSAQSANHFWRQQHMGRRRSSWIAWRSESARSGLVARRRQLLLPQYNTNVSNILGASGALNTAGNTEATGLLGTNQTALQNMLAGGQFAGFDPWVDDGAGDHPTRGGKYPSEFAGRHLGCPRKHSQSDRGARWPDQRHEHDANVAQSTVNNPRKHSRIWRIAWQPIQARLRPGARPADQDCSVYLDLVNNYSDIRVKENVEPVGMLFDGLPIYSFRYAWDDPRITRIGLMAQDVEKVKPEAVGEVGGIKTVDYRAATEDAARLAA